MYHTGWLGSRVVSVLDLGAVGPGFKSQSRRCRITVWGKLFTPIVHQAAKVVAALLKDAGVTAGLAESNGSLPPGLWLTSPAGWLLRTGISSGTLRSVIEYRLPLPLCILYLSCIFNWSFGVSCEWFSVSCSLLLQYCRILSFLFFKWLRV